MGEQESIQEKKSRKITSNPVVSWVFKWTGDWSIGAQPTRARGSRHIVKHQFPDHDTPTSEIPEFPEI